jgi:hypothetical protein
MGAPLSDPVVKLGAVATGIAYAVAVYLVFKA